MRPLSDGRALRHRPLSAFATWQLKELGTNSLHNYARWRLRLVPHLSGPAELLELHWVVSEPIAIGVGRVVGSPTEEPDPGLRRVLLSVL